MLRDLLAHPLTRGLDENHPLTTDLRREIVLGKPFLRSIYLEWYRMLLDALPAIDGQVLELGSGAGFFQQLLPEAITSEVFACGGIKAVLDARRMPFPDASLRAIVMTDVMHHIPDVERFLAEARRTLKPGGRLLMVEPWVSAWSTFVYTRFHPEPFRPDAPDWSFPPSGPLSGANGAIPWIVFRRDLERFRRLFPELELAAVEPFMPLRYLLSGGVSMRALAPGWSFGLAKALEAILLPWRDRLAMFAFIQLNRR
jgi:SAM-dependent methyltransferase